MADVVVSLNGAQHQQRRFKDMGDGTYAEVVYVGGGGLSAGDIEIGAVEIKNDADDTRAKVGAGVKANALRVVWASDEPVPAGEHHIGAVGGHVARISANFTRPADTTAYASGDLVANSTTAGSVVPMAFALSRAAGAGGMIRRVRLRKTGTSITNAAFRLHLYSASPTPANGDNGAWSTDQAATYVGSLDISCDKTFSDGAGGNGLPSVGSEIIFTADTYYGLLEARGAYTPGNAEQFTLLLEVVQN